MIFVNHVLLVIQIVSKITRMIVITEYPHFLQSRYIFKILAEFQLLISKTLPIFTEQSFLLFIHIIVALEFSKLVTALLFGKLMIKL